MHDFSFLGTDGEAEVVTCLREPVSTSLHASSLVTLRAQSVTISHNQSLMTVSFTGRGRVVRVLDFGPGFEPSTLPLDLFSVALSSTLWLDFVNSQLVCHQPVGILKPFMFIYNVCF